MKFTYMSNILWHVLIDIVPVKKKIPMNNALLFI